MGFYSEDKEIFEVLSKIMDLEKQLGEGNDNRSSKKPFLISIEKRKRLEEEKEELEKEYELLLIQLNRIEIRHSPNEKGAIDFFRYLLKIHCNIDEIWDYSFDDILDFHEQDEEGILDRGYFLNNYYELKPPYVRPGTKIPKGIKNIYHESRRCFVYGQFSAAVALSRTVIETILKHKFNLRGRLDDIINLASERKLISEKAKWHAHKVRMFANKILHKANVATKNQAKNSIDHVLDFIEEIYLE